MSITYSAQSRSYTINSFPSLTSEMISSHCSNMMNDHNHVDYREIRNLGLGPEIVQGLIKQRLVIVNCNDFEDALFMNDQQGYINLVSAKKINHTEILENVIRARPDWFPKFEKMFPDYDKNAVNAAKIKHDRFILELFETNPEEVLNHLKAKKPEVLERIKELLKEY